MNTVQKNNGSTNFMYFRVLSAYCFFDRFSEINMPMKYLFQEKNSILFIILCQSAVRQKKQSPHLILRTGALVKQQTENI
ncbi:MAG: hypothetical protein WCP20_03435 [Desulfuromonadales bacterium]